MSRSYEHVHLQGSLNLRLPSWGHTTGCRCGHQGPCAANHARLIGGKKASGVPWQRFQPVYILGQRQQVLQPKHCNACNFGATGAAPRGGYRR